MTGLMGRSSRCNRLADYLGNGQKHGREPSREELDGDLELTDAFINSMGKRGRLSPHHARLSLESMPKDQRVKLITATFHRLIKPSGVGWHSLETELTNGPKARVRFIRVSPCDGDVGLCSMRGNNTQPSPFMRAGF
jgi:hypothetical protein